MDLNRIQTLQLVSVRWWNASAYYAISLCDALTQSGFRSYAGGRGDSPPLVKARRRYDLPLFDIINLESLNPVTMVQSLARLTRFIQNPTISLVNAHRPEDHIFAYLARQRSKRQIPLIRTISDVRPPKDQRFNRLLHEKTDFFIFTSKSSFDRYQSVWPIFQDNSAIIYGALNTDQFQADPQSSRLRQHLEIPESDILIGIVARLDPVKNHDMFLKAAAILAAKVPNARFLIAGESCNIQMDTLREQALGLGIEERCHFMERTPEWSARELIAALDIGVVTSRGSEVICRVAAEYMAMGKPVVVTDVNVLPEMVDDGINGFVVGNNDHQTLARRLELLCFNPEVRLHMGREARRYAEERFSYSTLVEKTLEVYAMLLRRGETLL